MSRETRLHSTPGVGGWARRRDIPIAILAWVGVVVVALWAASHVIRAILLLVIAALFAYALAPLMRILQRVIPRVLAIVFVYIFCLGILSLFGYLAINTAIHQTVSLNRQIQILLSPGPGGQLTLLEHYLANFGITPGQVLAARQQIIAQAEEFVRNSLPLLRGALEVVIDTVLVAVLSVYLLLDGARAAEWVRHNAPNMARASFFLDTLQRVVGGYIRSQFILALLISVLVGVGMTFFRLPYAVFLGALAFPMAFIPVLGTFISGAVCVLVALTQGWLIALGVLIYFAVIHVLEGQVLGPRIVGHAVGLHPVVSLFALVAGAELFGIWGALFASPIAGVVQAVIISLWTQWRATHPEHFQGQEEGRET